MEAGQYFAKLEYKHTFFEACIVRPFDPADGRSWRWLVRDFYRNLTTNRQIKRHFEWLIFNRTCVCSLNHQFPIVRFTSYRIVKHKSFPPFANFFPDFPVERLHPNKYHAIVLSAKLGDTIVGVSQAEPQRSVGSLSRISRVLQDSDSQWPPRVGADWPIGKGLLVTRPALRPSSIPSHPAPYTAVYTAHLS